MDALITGHFQSSDLRIAELAETYGIPKLIPADNYFLALSESIVSQQLSIKAADTIMGRFSALFPNKLVTPEKVMELDFDLMRSVGLSGSKARYVKNLAEFVLHKRLQPEYISQLSDEDVIAELTQVKGIGRWTAEMFLMFTLGRPDVFSFGDVGLQNAIQRLYGLKKKPSVLYMKRISNKWRPYRTYAARLLWKSLNNTPTV